MRGIYEVRRCHEDMLVVWRYSSTILNLGTRWTWVALPLYPRRNCCPGTHCTRMWSWVGSRAGLGDVEKWKMSRPFLESNPESPVVQSHEEVVKMLQSEWILKPLDNFFITFLINQNWVLRSWVISCIQRDERSSLTYKGKVVPVLN
jgi:hypothetical protein